MTDATLKKANELAKTLNKEQAETLCDFIRSFGNDITEDILQVCRDFVSDETETEIADDMSELDKLQKYLDNKGISYDRTDTETIVLGMDMGRHQINVYKDQEKTALWFDAICHYGSYGYEDGLLEIMGDIVENECDDVEGWLTAEDIINRMENKKGE